MLIEQWYETESKKVLLQSRSDDVSQSEKVRIYHYDLHKKNIKRSYILKLQTENGLLEGQASSTSYLESQVGDLLLNPAPLDRAARQCLLDEVVHVYTDQDNNMLRAVPVEKEVMSCLPPIYLLLLVLTAFLPFCTMSAGK